MNWTRWSLLTILAGFPRANDKRQTCLREGKTLKVVLCTKFCPACDKQAIASALVQLRINFTCIFKVFQIALVASRLGQFCENFEIKLLVKLILNFPRAHAITYTKRISVDGT